VGGAAPRWPPASSRLAPELPRRGSATGQNDQTHVRPLSSRVNVLIGVVASSAVTIACSKKQRLQLHSVALTAVTAQKLTIQSGNRATFGGAALGRGQCVCDRLNISRKWPIFSRNGSATESQR